METTLVDIEGTDAKIETTFRAIRTTLKPLEWKGYGKVLGHYRLTAFSGTIAAAMAANSEVFGVRWGDSSNLMVLLAVRAAIGVFTAGQTVANPIILEAAAARGWTTDYTANATAIKPGSAAQKMRSANMGTSIFNDLGTINVCTTLGMTGSVKTIDTAGFGCAMYPGNALGVADKKNLLELSQYSHPPCFANREGFIIRNQNQLGAAATYVVAVEMEWAEVPEFGG